MEKKNPNNKTNYFQIESYAFAKSIFQESDNTQLNFRYKISFKLHIHV